MENPVELPRRDPDGRLWLGAGGSGSAVAERDTLAVEVYRRVDDDIPLRVVTRLDLDVAGRAREVQLGPVLLAGAIPLAVAGPLPARLDPDGTLRLQVRPGHWVVELTSHHPGPVAELALAAHPAPWPGQEVWVFAAHPELREVQLSGAAPVDPRQTRLPPGWARLPAFLLRPGEALRLTQVRRGDAESAPDRLSLSRDLWLDFGGGGYTLRDRIGGELTRTWRLEAGEGMDLGQVSVDGEPRFITRLGDAPREGVEVRQGRLDLVADSRIEGATRRLPASGWALDFQSHRDPAAPASRLGPAGGVGGRQSPRHLAQPLDPAGPVPGAGHRAGGGPALGLGLGGADPHHPGTDLAVTGGTAAGVAACARGLCPAAPPAHRARPCGHDAGAPFSAPVLPGGPRRPGPDRPSLPG